MYDDGDYSDQINAAQVQSKRLSLLVAPAGYGKTLLSLQLLKKLDQQYLWYHLDSYDNDPAVFLNYLINGFRQRIPNFGWEALGLIQQGNVTQKIRMLAAIFINALVENSTEFYLVLDDYHVITDPVIHEFLQELLRQIPEQVHLIITSRNPLPFATVQFEISDSLAVYGVDQLRFEPEEIAEYLRYHQIAVSDLLVEEMVAKTGGWPVALKLCSIFSNGALSSFNERASQDIYQYLATEVLNQLTKEERDFLIATSIFDEITPRYCDLLLGRSDSGEILKRLARQQLFIVPLSGSVEVYRCHQLFREFLQSNLGTKRGGLLRKAGFIARELGDGENAIEYFLAADSMDEVLATIENAGKTAMHQGRWQTVARWLKHLTYQQIASNPWLSLYRAQIGIHQGLREEAERWAQKASDLFNNAKEFRGLVESRILEARILRCRGQLEESLKLLNEAESLIDLKAEPRIDLPLEKTLTYYLSGRIKEAESTIAMALKTVEPLNNGYLNANLLEGMGTIQYLQGNYQKALQFYKKGMEASPDRVLPGYYAQDSISTIYQDWGEFNRALEYAKRSLSIKETYGLIESLPSAYAQIAGIYVDLGEYKIAEEYYQRAVALCKENKSEFFYLTLNLIFLAQCLYLQKRFSEAEAKVEEALKTAGKGPNLAWANCHTVGGVIFLGIGKIPEAETMLLQAVNSLEQMGFKKALCNTYEGLAALYFRKQNPQAVADYASKAITLAARLNDIQSFITFYHLLQPVLRFGIEAGIEINFINRVLTRLGETCKELLKNLASHSSPDVRRRVIIPIVEIMGEKAEPIIRRLIDDPHPQVAELASTVAVKYGIKKDRAERAGEATQIPLHLNYLGPLRIILYQNDITTINWRTGKARDLLIYLAHLKEPVTKERILEDLWPNEEPDKSGYLFHSTIYRLRQVLNRYQADEFVCYGGGRYQLLPDIFEADWQEFEKLITTANGKKDNPDQKADYLEKAVLLYRGDYLEGMDYHWILPWQERYKNLCIEARLSLVKYYLAKKEYQKAIIHLNHLLELNNLMEEAYTLMMNAYAGLGDRLAIIKLYEKLVDIFKNELGLNPSREISDLYNKLCG